ncbi:MAG: 3-polyprenyl-4-hydroxybenzoate carboxy-lyase UbiX [Amycolatopsis sp.]|uniref:UbiX family flavin prenyltransferase n=1 Tax=Amycolatopsis sp. TaxID=37632 RepID=UPI002631EC42|nr:UbiX family flavin prenyltransferase [Amycolatopsis sp.]MCU1682010.1 3-polyprenyl-4-hydroxybenzoate carboxy-lyase UbiX [Amycolatopsis sp.]
MTTTDHIPRRLVVAITGATGAAIGIAVLTALAALKVETHLVLSRWARTTIAMETDLRVADVTALADHVHGIDNQSASISSGSFPVDGMIIAPCSMKTLAAIRAGFGDNLINRAADVTLKERRRLVLAVRETPLSPIHLENMLALSRIGATIMPPVPAFYTRPTTVADVVEHTAARILDQFGLTVPDIPRWAGPPHLLGTGESTALEGAR